MGRCMHGTHSEPFIQNGEPRTYAVDQHRGLPKEQTQNPSPNGVTSTRPLAPAPPTTPAHSFPTVPVHESSSPDKGSLVSLFPCLNEKNLQVHAIVRPCGRACVCARMSVCVCVCVCVCARDTLACNLCTGMRAYFGAEAHAIFHLHVVRAFWSKGV